MNRHAHLIRSSGVDALCLCLTIKNSANPIKKRVLHKI